MCVLFNHCPFRGPFFIHIALDSLSPDIVGIARLQQTMAKVGASVTMTTITDIMAFAISSSTDFPAIEYFCYYALTTILLSYVLLMTVFLAVLALDIRRIENSRWDWVCCIKKESYQPWTKYQSTISKRVSNILFQIQFSFFRFGKISFKS